MSDPSKTETGFDPQELRVDYGRATLSDSDLVADPIKQFGAWLAEARKAGASEPNAMTLATVASSGAPSARIVLLKGFDASGFTFHTNYLSRKGEELAANPRVALCFHWQLLERQVRIEGTAEKSTRAESESYFRTRPVEAQIGAWVSQQSQPISSRAELERLQAELTKKFAGGPVPLPEFWGGYRIVPQSLEFWQGRPSRLHDRFLYTRISDGAWKHQRLSP